MICFGMLVLDQLTSLLVGFLFASRCRRSLIFITLAKAELGLGERGVAAKSVEEQQIAVLSMCMGHKKC